VNGITRELIYSPGTQASPLLAALLADPFCNLHERDGKLLQKGEIGLFQSVIMDFFQAYGREFPWRSTTDPYRVLLSELMLQQTQTERVLPKYIEFIELWPDFAALDAAPFSEILALWKGLGYNRRALALKKIARQAVVLYSGSLPQDLSLLLKLPMVGPATAAAIRAFSWNLPSLYLETNIRRVLIYFFFDTAERVNDRELYLLLKELLPPEDPKSWYYALMDYGVFLKKMIKNPNRRSAHYTRQPSFENSNRQIRGQILTVFTESGKATRKDLYRYLSFSEERVDACLNSLMEEGFVAAADAAAAESEPVYMLKEIQ
jgi:A/G-specific adenine glycosylase